MSLKTLPSATVKCAYVKPAIADHPAAAANAHAEPALAKKEKTGLS